MDPSDSCSIHPVVNDGINKNGRMKYGNNIFKTAWNLLTNVYDGSRQKPLTIVHSKRYRSEAEDTIIEVNGNCEEGKRIPAKDAESVSSSRPLSSNGASCRSASNVVVHSCPSAMDGYAYGNNCDKTISRAEIFTGGGENPGVGVNSLLDDNYNIMSRSNHRTDVDLPNTQIHSRSCGRLKATPSGACNRKQYVRLSEIFQDIRSQNDKGTPQVLSRTFLDSVQDQIRQIRTANNPPNKSTSNLSPVLSDTSIVNSMDEPNEIQSNNNLNINLTVSLAQVQGASGTAVEVGKPTTVRINVPTGKSDCVVTHDKIDPPPNYPASWTSVSPHSLENAVVTSANTGVSHMDVPLAGVPLAEEVKYHHDENNLSRTEFNTASWIPSETAFTVNEEGDLYQNTNWSSYFTLANAFEFTGQSIKKVYEVAGDIVTNYIIPADPHLRTEEEMNFHEDKVAISMMRLMGIPQQTRHSIYNEALQEVQVIHDVSTGTIDLLQNIISWLCTGDTKATNMFMEKTRILATMQSEVDAESEVWKQWENDFLLFSETVSNLVRGSVKAAKKYTTDEDLMDVSGKPDEILEELEESKVEQDDESILYDSINDENISNDDVDFVDCSSVVLERHVDDSEFNSLPEEINKCGQKILLTRPSYHIINNSQSLQTDNDETYQPQFILDENENVVTDCSYEQQSNSGNDAEFSPSVSTKQTPSTPDVFYEAEDKMFHFTEDDFIMADEDSHRIQVEKTFNFPTVTKSLNITETIIATASEERLPKVQSESTTITDNITQSINETLEKSCSQEDTVASPSQFTTETYSDSDTTELEEMEFRKSKVINSRHVLLSKNRSGIPLLCRRSMSVHKGLRNDEVEDEDSAGGDEVIIKHENSIQSYYDGNSYLPEGNLGSEGNVTLDLNENDSLSAKYELVSESQDELNNSAEGKRSENWTESSFESKLQSELLALEEVAQVLYTNMSPSRGIGSATSLYSTDEMREMIPIITPAKQRRSRIPRRKVNTSTTVLENKENTNSSRSCDKESKLKSVVNEKKKESFQHSKQQKQSSNECQEQESKSTISLYGTSPLRNSCACMDNLIENIKPTPPKSNNSHFIKPQILKRESKDHRSNSRTRPTITQPNSRQIVQPMKAHPIPSIPLQKPLKRESSDFQAVSLSKPFDFNVEDSRAKWKQSVEAMKNRKTVSVDPDSASRGESYVDIKYRHPHTSYRELLHTKRQVQTTITATKSTPVENKRMGFKKC